MDARSFLGITPVDVALRWRLEVTEEVSTPGKFLYGGCALGAALVALEHASGRSTAWATAQYLSFAETGTTLDLDVTLAVSGKGVTQGRAVGRVGGREILTVNARSGSGPAADRRDVGGAAGRRSTSRAVPKGNCRRCSATAF